MAEINEPTGAVAIDLDNIDNYSVTVFFLISLKKVNLVLVRYLHKKEKMKYLRSYV